MARWRGRAASLAGLVLAGLLVLLLAACGERSAPPQTPTAAPPPQRAALPADFVMCIDNSRSITPQEQALLRETAMLLADLADPGDRIAVLTFDDDARIVTAMRVKGNDDRRAFKKVVTEKVDFAGNHSDIRRCISLLATRQDELFGARGQSVRVPIVLSDGKLEPKDRKLREAFDEMRSAVQGPLAETGLYAVVLGDTYSREPLLQVDGRTINGVTLMRDYVALAVDRYFHATRLDQLLPITVGILNRAKNIGSLGEEGAREFRIDDTVERMSFIVRKRSVASGAPIATSSEIEIVAPRGVSDAPITLANHRQVLGDAAYWSSYEYFDLIVLRRPAPGNWAVRLTNGKAAEVLSKVVTPVALRIERRPFYFLNEAGVLSAWLEDRGTGKPLAGDYVLQARAAAGTPLKDSQTFVDLSADAAAHQYLLAMPGGVAQALGRDPAAGPVQIEVIARRRGKAEGSDFDPWFIRRFGPFSVDLREPFVDFLTQERTLARLPFRDLALVFGADFHARRASTPAFEGPPRVTLEIEQRPEDGKTYQPMLRQQLDGKADQAAIRYRSEQRFSREGEYRYRYRVSGNVAEGALVIQSPWRELRVAYAWGYALAGLAFLLACVAVASSRTARLRGQLVVKREGRTFTIAVPPARVFDSVQASTLNPKIDLANCRFRLVAKRLLYVRKRIGLTLLAGEAVLEGSALTPGRAVVFAPRDKELSLRCNGAPVVVRIALRVT